MHTLYPIERGNMTTARNYAAEVKARTERLDEDRIILAALEALHAQADDRSISSESGAMLYIAGAANVATSDFPYASDAATYIKARITAIRARLSPVVR